MALLRRASLVALIACFAIPAQRSFAQLMKCRLPNGSLYVGISPPADCGPVSNARERGPSDAGTSSKPGKFLPTPTPASKQTDGEDRPTLDEEAR
jgi:hypothetical protein